MGRWVALALLCFAGCLGRPDGDAVCTDGTAGPNVDLTVIDAVTAAPLRFSVTVDGAAAESALAATPSPCRATATTLALDAGILSGRCGAAPARDVTLTVALR